MDPHCPGVDKTEWRNYYSLNELPSLTRKLLGWIRKRLRSLLWKQ
ncbi:hypothetical protein M5J15_14160 [Serratia symbiotica]|nr:group II intron maturase-specific domain-containing protein [Serratia symbiotica]USS95496.1 hypothetical protein M5J15_14160 [Serratia symbiotica]